MKSKQFFTVMVIFFSQHLFSQGVRSIENIGFDEISIIELAGNGDIWVGSNGDGVAFFDSAQHVWSYFNSSNTPQLTSDTITAIALAIIGNVQHSFIGTTSGAPYTQAGSGWTSLTNVSTAKVAGISYHPDSLWILTATNIVRFDSAKSFQQTNSAPFVPITCTQRPTSCGGIWSGTANNGLFYTSNGTNFSFIDTSTPNKKLVDNRVNALAVDNNCNAKFVGTKGGFSVCPTNGPPCQNFTTANGLPQNDITAVAIDCSGKVWLGTRDSGIVIFPGFSRMTVANGLPSNQITAISFGATCKASIGMKDGNIAVLDTNKTVLQILTGIGKVKKVDYAIHIFPQPSFDQINFVCEREISNGEFFLNDINGRVFQHFSMGNTNHFTVDVSSLDKGVYFYQIISYKHLVKTGKVEVVR